MSRFREEKLLCIVQIGQMRDVIVKAAYIYIYSFQLNTGVTSTDHLLSFTVMIWPQIGIMI